MFAKFFKFLSRLVLPKIVVIGLDIQDRHLAAVATARRGDRIETVGSAIVEIEDDVIEGGGLKRADKFSKALDDLMQGLPRHIFKKLESEPIFVLSIPPQHMYTETAVFPLMDEGDLEGAVRLKIETSLPWSLDQTYFDWIRVPIKDRNKIGAFIVAAERSTIDEYLKVFVEKNWRVSACEFHLLSLSKFVGSATDPFMFVLLDEDGIEFSVFNTGKIITHYLQKISIDKKSDLADVLKANAQHLSAFVEGNFGVSIKQVYILADDALASIIADVESEIRTPTMLISPPSSIERRFFIAQGAAQREYGETEVSINLVPGESSGRYQENLLLKTISFWTKILLVFSFTFLAAFIGMFSFAQKQNVGFLKTNNDLQKSLDDRMAQMQGTLEDVNAFNSLAQRVRDRSEYRTRIVDKLRVLQEQVAQTGLSINEMRYKSSEVILSVVAPTRENALKFKSNLDALGKFSSVTIPTAQLLADQNLPVTISIKL